MWNLTSNQQQKNNQKMATDVQKYKQHTLNDLWAKEGIIREIRKYFELANETAFHNS